MDHLSSLNLSITFLKHSKLLQLKTAVFNQVPHLDNMGSRGNEIFLCTPGHDMVLYKYFFILLTNLFTFGNISLTLSTTLLNM